VASDNLALSQCGAVAVNDPEQRGQVRLGAYLTTQVDVLVADQRLR